MRTFAKTTLALFALSASTAALAQQSFGPPPVQAISASSLPLPSGAATSANQATEITSLGTIATAMGSLFQAGGSIGNTAFGISGTLPAFATTPTFNIGTAPTIGVTGTFWQTTQPVSAASLPLPTGAAVSVAQGSTTSGLSGDLVMGSVTTSSPSYTTAQTSPLSLTTGGALRSDFSTVGGVAISNAASNGSGKNGIGVIQATAIASTESVVSFAAAGSGSVAAGIVNSATGGGVAVTAEITFSALTLGTATSIIPCLQQSGGGANFTDIWCGDPVTASGTYTMPAIPVAGRRRWRFFSVGGTSTTATVSINAEELPGGFPIQRQFRDAYAATNPFATIYNSAALAASNFVLGTLNSATTPFYVEGTKQIIPFMILAGSPTVTTQPVVTLQLSMDGTNWWTTAATMTAVGNGVYATTSQSIGGARFSRLKVSTAEVDSSGAYTISAIGVNAVN